MKFVLKSILSMSLFLTSKLDNLKMFIRFIYFFTIYVFDRLAKNTQVQINYLIGYFMSCVTFVCTLSFYAFLVRHYTVYIWMWRLSGLNFSDWLFNIVTTQLARAGWLVVTIEISRFQLMIKFFRWLQPYFNPLGKYMP